MDSGLKVFPISSSVGRGAGAAAVVKRAFYFQLKLLSVAHWLQIGHFMPLLAGQLELNAVLPPIVPALRENNFLSGPPSDARIIHEEETRCGGRNEETWNSQKDVVMLQLI